MMAYEEKYLRIHRLLSQAYRDWAADRDSPARIAIPPRIFVSAYVALCRDNFLDGRIGRTMAMPKDWHIKK
jgi:hypothetical protein